MTNMTVDITPWGLRTQVVDHLTTIVKNRSIVLTGDMGHLSIDHMINQSFANIDAPRKYDFQDPKVHEHDALRALLWAVPEYMLPDHISANDVAQAIAGNTWLETQDFSHGSNKCYDCGQILGLKFKGNFVEVYCQNVCDHNREFTVEIDFPTGNVVFADWPDHFEDLEAAGILVSENDSVNYLKGQRQASENYARTQILHHSVGNTCPSWSYNPSTQTLHIGSMGYNEDTDEEIVAEGFEHKGSFCTDLWWVTMLDEQYYNAMLAQAGVEGNSEECKNERATIAPGRYRFTCFGRTSDSMGLHARAERIGECGAAPIFDAAHGRRVLSVVEAAGHSRAQFPRINQGDDANVMFGFLDQNFNVIGNGVKNYGDFLSHHSVNDGERAQGEALKWSTDSVVNVTNVYPNFTKHYSLVWTMPLKFFPTDWLVAAVWFYETCRTYFEAGAQDYSSAYPSTNNRNRDKDTLEAMKKLRTEDMSDAEFYAAVSKRWGAVFDGDIVAFNTQRWEREKATILEFIGETLQHLRTEVGARG